MAIRKLIILLLSTPVTGFVPSSCSQTRSSSATLRPFRSSVLLHSKLFDEDSNDEELIGSGSNSAPSDGDALAKEFYRQLRERQQESSADKNTGGTSESLPPPAPKSSTSSSNFNDDTDRRLTEAQKRDQNAKPFSKRSVVSVASTASADNNSNQNRPRKYTGQSDSPLFGNVPPGSTREKQSPRQAMMEREFRLAGVGSGLGLGIQAVVAVFALAFYLYVGLSGGIVSGGGDDDFGGDDAIEYEQVIPVPRDTEKSVWI